MTNQNPKAFGNRIKPAHKSVSRAVGYALTNRDETAMWLLSATINLRLPQSDVAFLAVGILTALEDSPYCEVIRFLEGCNE